MSFPKYPAYKESGVAWLNQVPAHWEVQPCRAVFTERAERNDPLVNEDYLSLMANVGVIPYAEKGDVGNKKPDDLSKCKLVFAGDLVINSMNYGIGSYGLSALTGVCSPVYIVLKPKLDRIEERYAFRILENKAFQGFAQSHGNGILEHRAAINWDILKGIGVPLPPVSEQQSIVGFLDHETAKIDALVAEQERLIELLKEKRQAIISHAVTKGLDPSVPMKDSGVEWLGQVPEHWEICALKRIADLKSGESITANDIEEDGEFPVFGGNGLRGFTTGFTHEGTYALVGRQGALCGNVNYATGKFWASEHAVVATPKAKLETYWLGELMRTMNLNQYSISAAQPGLSVEIVGNLRITVPPVSEQGGIANFLKHETAKIDALVAEAHTAISLYQERRTALISAAVTGQIDVRGFASPRTDV